MSDLRDSEPLGELPSAEAYRRRIGELEARLADAEETLDAIRSGDVDAVVVGEADERRVFTLEGADRPYRILIEQMAEGAATLSTEGMVLYCNQAFADLARLPARDLIGVRLQDLLASSREPLKPLLEGGGRTEIEIRSDHKPQTVASLSLSPLDTDEGSLVCAVVTDLTESRVHARDLADARQELAVEQARREGEESYRALFNSIDAGFCIVRMRFDTRQVPIDYQIVEANSAFGRMTGLEGAQGKWVSDIAPGLERHWFEIYGRVALTGEPARFESHSTTLGDRWFDVYAYRVGRPDACQVAILFNDISDRRRAEAAVRELNDKLEQRVVERTAELASANDRLQIEVGERRRTEEALRQSQKLEAMGQLTGGVAHDFNNLLTPIVGSLDMLVRRGLGSERERRLIEGALQSAERAKTLVQRLLAFARRQPLQPQAVDLRRLVGGMADLISSTTGPNVDVRVDMSDDLPPATADANQVEMAVLNLAVNARDAMPRGGILSIALTEKTVEADEISGLRPGHYVRISVADTGVGMDEATLTRAIEPFFSTKGIGKGTGLGLSMIHGLALQLNGGLTIESKVGQGTSVILWLPVSAGMVDRDQLRSGLSEHLAGMGTALLVDDEELVRLSTADMLLDLGYEVAEASSAEEALRLIGEGLKPDVLITDHLMPGLSGTVLAQELRLRRPDLPVLIVSGYAEAEGIDPQMPRLTKPFRNAELAASLAALGAIGDH